MIDKVMKVQTVKNPLSESKLNKKGLCDYVINVATGCLHGCSFCYVPATPSIRCHTRYLQDLGVANPQMDWGNYLFVREEIPSQLDELLSTKRTWRHTSAGKGVILLCSGTDPYQNKRTSVVTRQVIEILLKHKKRIRLLTRSPLWNDDLDILAHPNITIGMSLPYLDDSLSRQIEPLAPPPSVRLKALQKGKEAGCRLYIAVAPTPPMMGIREFFGLFETIAFLEPEVVFWESINARGTNGKRMQERGLKWAEQIMSRRSAAKIFDQQVKVVTCASSAFNVPLHIWPDQELAKHLDYPIDEWFYRPTKEVW